VFRLPASPLYPVVAACKKKASAWAATAALSRAHWNIYKLDVFVFAWQAGLMYR
jgi:hypothetical protein